MKIEVLSQQILEKFFAYCRKHRMEIDDSFLYDEDLRAFEMSEENPTFIAVNEQGEIAAAASLIMDAYHQKGRKARFRIFHSESEETWLYQQLLNKITEHIQGLDYDQLFIFVPDVNVKLMGIIAGLNFKIERYSYLLVNENVQAISYSLPPGYTLKPFRPGQDENDWVRVRNAGFAQLKGSETPVTPEMAAKLAKEEDYLEGGMMLLYHQDLPVGIVRGSDDEYEGAPIMNIGPVALIPGYQGKGLGRILLRAALHFAGLSGYSRVVLCVNAENERAKALYLQEGFKQMECAVNYRYDLKTK